MEQIKSKIQFDIENIKQELRAQELECAIANAKFEQEETKRCRIRNYLEYLSAIRDVNQEFIDIESLAKGEPECPRTATTSQPAQSA